MRRILIFLSLPSFFVLDESGRDNVLKQQFDLLYYAGLDFGDSNAMSVYERNFLYESLVEVKKAEKEAHEEEARKAKAQASKSKVRRR